MNLNKLPSRNDLCKELAEHGIARVRNNNYDGLKPNDLVRIHRIAPSGNNLIVVKLVGNMNDTLPKLVSPKDLERF